MSTVAEAAEAAGQPAARPLAAWLQIGLRVVVVSVAVGLLVSPLAPTLAATVVNVVYSVCIGISIFAMHALLRTRWALRRGVTVGAYLWRSAIAIPVGYLVGVNLGALATGTPLGLPALDSMAPFAMVLTVVTSGCLMYFFWARNRIAEAAAVRADEERTTAEARLKLLQAQIEPHMLFNTLANLRSLVEIDPPRAQAMIDELIVYLRATLAASRTATTTLEHEFAHLAAYLKLMQIRMASRLRIAIELPAQLRACAIPPMLLQPLVENAIRHGLEPKIEGGTVWIVASATSVRLQVEVVDDGVGLGDEPSVGGGYGLAHVRERLQTLHGEAARLVIEPRSGGGVSARVELPR